MSIGIPSSVQPTENPDPYTLIPTTDTSASTSNFDVREKGNADTTFSHPIGTFTDFLKAESGIDLSKKPNGAKARIAHLLFLPKRIELLNQLYKKFFLLQDELELQQLSFLVLFKNSWNKDYAPLFNISPPRCSNLWHFLTIKHQLQKKISKKPSVHEVDSTYINLVKMPLQWWGSDLKRTATHSNADRIIIKDVSCDICSDDIKKFYSSVAGTECNTITQNDETYRWLSCTPEDLSKVLAHKNAYRFGPYNCQIEFFNSKDSTIVCIQKPLTESYMEQS